MSIDIKYIHDYKDETIDRLTDMLDALEFNGVLLDEEVEFYHNILKDYIMQKEERRIKEDDSKCLCDNLYQNRQEIRIPLSSPC